VVPITSSYKDNPKLRKGIGEVGDAHSSVDLKDNITFGEQRGIASDKVFKERSTKDWKTTYKLDLI
jgi:hypothetical protein